MKTTTAELTSSRTQIQRVTAVIVTGSCHLRIEPGGNITVHTPLACFLLPLPAFTRKHTFPPTKFLHVSWNIFPLEKKKKNESPCKGVFFSSVHTVPDFLCSVSSPLKDEHVILRRRRHFTTTFYFRALFPSLFWRVGTRLLPDLMDISCVFSVCLCYSLA